MGSLLYTSNPRPERTRKKGSGLKPKSERLGWKSMSENESIRISDFIGKIKSTDTSLLSCTYTSCAKIL